MNSLTQEKFLTDQEMRHLELLLKSKLTDNKRDCLLILLALKTGARASEVLNLTKADINLHTKSVFIRGLKGSNDREIPIQPLVFKHLVSYLSTIEGERVFPISYERLVQIWSMWRVVKKPFKSLRHTFAVQLYKQSKNIRLVQQALGHKSALSSEIYQSYVFTQSELRKNIL
jgi:integrase